VVCPLLFYYSPIDPAETDNRETTGTGSAAVGNGIANTGSQTIKGPLTITGGGSSPPGETPAEPGSASAGTGIANTGNQTIEGPVIIGRAPGEEKR
jgi:hypothetical protein